MLNRFFMMYLLMIIECADFTLYAAEEKEQHREKNKPVQVGTLTEEEKAFLDFLKQKKVQEIEKSGQPITQGNLTVEEKEFLNFLNEHQ